jgi:hypothetical protein
VSAKLQTVHVRVNDAATGQPTPCRVRFTDAEGKYLAPYGRLAEFATTLEDDVGGNVMVDGHEYAYIDGTCEIDLPVGPIHAEIHKGPEFLPIVRELSVTPGKLALRFAVERWSNVRLDGWHSGDALAHCLSPSAALLEGMAEDLTVVNVLAQVSHHPKRLPHITNILDFSGQRAAAEAPGHLVAVNTLNHGLALLNCHRVVYPLATADRGGPLRWTLLDLSGQCHRKGGLVLWLQPNALGKRDPSNEIELKGESLADAILGEIDAILLTSLSYSAVGDGIWYTLLNSGFRIPLAAGSWKMSNSKLLGKDRLYARLTPGEEFSYRNWIEAVRGGRTFITNGPLLSLMVDGRGPGAVLDALQLSQKVNVRAESHSLVPFEKLEILVNGKVVASARAEGSPSSANLEVELPLERSCWLAGRCTGTHQPPKSRQSHTVAAHSSPVYCELEHTPMKADPFSLNTLMTHIDRMLEWVAKEARCESERFRDRLANIFHRARQELLNRAAI